MIATGTIAYAAASGTLVPKSLYTSEPMNWFRTMQR